ncbi:hypothetical protein Tco_0040813 [Tanacetum coccineum]
MVEENHPVAVSVTPKFDMPHHRSKLTSTDVKSITKEYDISLDLHPRAFSEGRSMDRFSKNAIGKGAGGKIFHETFSGMKGWKYKFFFIDKRAIPNTIAWRHHYSNVFDPLSDDDYSILDVRALAENIVDLRLVHHGLLFTVGLATIWEFPSVYSIFKDTRGNVIIMSEYIGFPFTANVAIKNGVAIPAKVQIVQHTTPPLLKDQNISDKTDSQWGLEVEDAKKPSLFFLATNPSSNIALHLFSFLKGHTASSSGTTSPTPIRTPSLDDNTLVIHSQSKEEDVGKNLCCFGPRSNTHNMLDNEDNVSHVSSYESANESIHNYIDVYAGYERDDTPWIEPFVNLSGQPLNDDNEQVFVD